MGDLNRFLSMRRNISSNCHAISLQSNARKDVGKYFGDISGAGITVRYNHLAKQIQLNHKLRRRIKQIKNKIIKMRPLSPLPNCIKSEIIRSGF
jgi:hypothetical protein